jgi:HD-GYP domain-containing protein (c-di-GMP phosphodiesterase class II)
MNGLHSLVPHDGVLLPFVLEGAALPGEARRRFEQYETCQRPLAMLLLALKAKDQLLYAHSQRVLRFTSHLTRVLHLQQAEATTIELAAHFHDAGKLAIHNELLYKASALTHLEFELIRRHPAYGVSILEKMGMLNRVTHVVYHHHEHWYGSGYLHGLQGEAIPLGARIVAIADALEVMISCRPYQAPRTPMQALTELRKCAGTQFDLALVERFCTSLEANLSGASPFETGRRAATNDGGLPTVDSNTTSTMIPVLWEVRSTLISITWPVMAT